MLILFRLSYADASFCHIMEQCLSDQQLITLLPYLDGIYILTASIDVIIPGNAKERSFFIRISFLL